VPSKPADNTRVTEPELEGRLAGRVGVRGAQVDLHRVAVEPAAQLGAPDLALVPAGLLLDEIAAGALAVLLALGEAGALERVADDEVGPPDPVPLAELVADADQTVDDDAVIRRDLAVVLVENRQRRVRGALLDVVLGAPRLTIAGGRDQAEFAVAELARGAAGRRERHVDRQLVVELDETRAGVHELLDELTGVDGARTQARTTREVRRDGRRHIAYAAVAARPVVLAAVMGVSELTGGLGVAADADTELEERLPRHRQRREVDESAAELAREVGRVALLHHR